MGGSEATRGGPPVGVVLMYHDLAPAEARVDPDRRPYVLERLPSRLVDFLQGSMERFA